MQKLIVALILGFSISAASAQSGVPLKLVQSIPLPDIDGRIDHISIDVRGRRAFLAALAKNTVEARVCWYSKPKPIKFVDQLRGFVPLMDALLEIAA